MSDTPDVWPPPADDPDEAARRAGWNPADGPAPFRHAMPPDVDPELGHNGISPTDADQVA